MRRINRRRLLKLSGAGTLAAGGGMAGILASGRAPAFAQGTGLHWLKFVDFVPVSDQLLKGKIKDDCKKALGIDLTIETINGDGIQARITSAIQSQSGPDIMMAVSNWAQLYADSLIDVSDIADAVGKAQGGFFQTSRDVANDGKRWIAMPFTILGVLFANRTSWFPRLASPPTSFRRPGTNTARSASS
jgi:multiple sugar transport system substrate-binding protein